MPDGWAEEMIGDAAELPSASASDVLRGLPPDSPALAINRTPADDEIARRELNGKPKKRGPKSPTDAQMKEGIYNPHTGMTYPNGDPEKRAQRQKRVISCFDLAHKELPVSKCIVDGIIPPGLTLLAGKPKIGKSWLALNVGIAVASGGTALGSLAVDRGAVLYLALEDTERRLKDRQAKLLAAQQTAPLASLSYALTWPRQDEGGLADLIERLDAYKTRLVIIDTLARFRPGKKGRDDYQQDTEAMSQLQALAHRYSGLALLVILHCRKMSSADPLDEILGTSGLAGAADASLILRRERGQHDAALFVTGRDIEEKDLALKWDSQYCLWSIAGDAAEYRMGKAKAEVLDLLRSEGRILHRRDIVIRTGKAEAAVKSMLWRMEREGLVVTDGKGGYAAK
jgi:hypothetical protein